MIIFFGNSFTGILEAIIWFFIVIGIVVPTYVFIPLLDSYLFPVLTDFSMYELGITDEGYPIYEFTYLKTRTRCKFIIEDMGWYILPDKYLMRVSYLNTKLEENNNISRPKGYNKSVPWIVHIPQEYQRTNQQILFTYKCFGDFLWSTKTTIDLIWSTKENRFIQKNENT